LESQREPSLELAQGDGNLRHPLAPLEVRPPARPLNVVWQVAESLRAEALTPEVMPQSSAFAARAACPAALQRRQRHAHGDVLDVLRVARLLL
jgi:membrane-anchored protein YejM (alkaline phosphatase superfamily)